MSCGGGAEAPPFPLLGEQSRIRGGQILAGRTRQVVHRLAGALRLAAPSLPRRPSYLGHYFRRRPTQLGTPAAITAAAHQLARVLYPIITTRQPYDQSVFAVREGRATTASSFV